MIFGPPDVTDDHCVCESLEETNSDDCVGASRLPPNNVGISGRAPNIIVVDDDPHIAKLFSLVLRQSGCFVSKTFGNGQDLLHHIANLEPEKDLTMWPDLVILDYRMPRLDGVETAKLLRMHYPKMKIVMISAYQPTNAGNGFFDAFLMKPVSMSILIDTVSAVLGG